MSFIRSERKTFYLVLLGFCLTLIWFNLVQPAKAAVIVLEDNFNGSFIDAGKWQTLNPVFDSSTQIDNGMLKFTNRGYLYSRQQYKPQTYGKLTISGRYKIGARDSFQVLTRSDAVPNPNDKYETTSGIEFFINQEHTVGRIDGRNATITNKVTTGTLTILPNDVLDFVVTDDGLNLAFTITKVATGQTFSMTAQSSYVGNANYIVIHNREYFSGSSITYLDYLVVNGETAPMSTSCSGSPVVSDSFNSNVLDTSVWLTRTAHPNSSFRLVSGQAEFSGRPFLYTKQQLTPSANAPLCISGIYKIDQFDFLQLLTRSDNTPETASGHYGVSNGLEFAITEEEFAQNVLIQGRGGIVVSNLVVTGNLTIINPNDVLAFKATDDGLNATFTVVNLTTGQYKQASAQSSTPGLNNYVLFHNRELNYHISYLDDVSIYQPVATPEANCNGTPVISDNFNNNVLDSSTWLSKTTLSYGSITPISGQLRFSYRPYLYTKQQYKPIPGSTICITGTYKIGSYDMFQLLTRSSTTAAGGNYETSNGLEFIVIEESNLVTIQGRGEITVTNLITTGNMVNIAANDVVKFRIIDDGTNAEFLLIKAATGEYKKITAKSTTPGLNNYILVHNRELQGPSYLDDINIYYSLPTIEASSGTPQSAQINSVFSSTLVALVKDNNGAPVSNTQVLFSAPASGASGVFAGGTLTYSATTDAQGQASATYFTANTITGTYTVTAALVNFPSVGAANFVLTNLEIPCNPFLVTRSTDDGSFGVCGSLTNAINEAVSAAQPVVISFAPTLTTVILTDKQLPSMSSSNGVTIDGGCVNGVPSVQITAVPGTLVASIPHLFRLGNNITLTGLKLTNYTGYAAVLSGTNSRLTCNWLGTTDGTTLNTNGGGIWFSGAANADNMLGDPQNPAKGNLIMANNDYGVLATAGTNNQLYNTTIKAGKLAAIRVANGAQLKFGATNILQK